MSIRQAFEVQAEACATLGSPFTARVLRLLNDLLTRQTAVGRRVLDWSGDPSVGADSVPLRLAGGLHALALSGQNTALAALYPPSASSDRTPDTALKQALTAALTENEALLLDWLNNAPQTNESGRAAALIPAAHMLNSQFNLPIALLELGASAGLNLRWDHVSLDLGSRRLGPKDAGLTQTLTLTPDWQGDLPETTTLNITSRKGVDLNPLDPTQYLDRLKLLSFIWPDQPDRLARMRAALDLATTFPVKITRSDAIDWLAEELQNPREGVLTIIYHTIAWQYFPQERQIAGKALIEQHGAKATTTSPLAWLSMENDGIGPGALLQLRLWPGDVLVPLGRADFHGRWVTWDVGSTLPTA